MVEETKKEVVACEREGNESIRLGITPALTLVCGTEIALTIREKLPQVFLVASTKDGRCDEHAALAQRYVFFRQHRDAHCPTRGQMISARPRHEKGR
jgi:hypothetical protein